MDGRGDREDHKSHLVQMRERLEEMSTLVRANLLEAQQRQREYYNKRVKEQPLEVGDEVLVLLPVKQNKLQLQWSGPYPITRKFTAVDYEVWRPVVVRKRKSSMSISQLQHQCVGCSCC